jgi:hypothetical protein
VPLIEAVADMLVRCDRQECMSRSVQQRAVADALLQQHLLTEMPDFDYLWGIADMFKVSLSCTLPCLDCVRGLYGATSLVF